MTQATQFSVPTTGPVSPDVMAGRIADNFVAALTGHSGASRPSYAEAGTIWQDTSVTDTVRIYFYDGAQDILLATINTAINKLTMPSFTAGGAILDAVFAAASAETKKLALNLAAITAGQTRSLIMPDRDVDLSKHEVWELIGPFSQTAVANAPITGLMDNTKYDRYRVQIDELLPATNGANLNMEVSVDNGSTFLTTAIYTTKIVRWDDAGTSNGGGNSLSAMVIANTHSNVSTQFLTGVMEFYHDKDNNVRVRAKFEYFSTGGFLGSETSARILTGAKINAIRFRTSSGNVAAINGRVYGRRI